MAERRLFLVKKIKREMQKLYNIILLLSTPLLYFYFKKRIKIGKENLARFFERVGKYDIEPPQNPIWFHAASVGETLSIIPLINNLAKSKNILLTTGTVSSERIARDRIAKNVVHQFIPIDRQKFVINFLEYFKPKLAVFVESELWPNLIYESEKKKIPMILLNARVSDKNKLKNFFYKIFAKNLLEKFKLILPQEQKDLKRMQELGLKNIKFIGNLKYSSPELPFDKKELEKLKKELKSRKIFLCASTHHNEEDLIAELHHNLRNSIPDLLTIIAPRHPARSEEIENALKSKEMLSVSVRSRNEKITERTDIYLANTIGELGLFYRLADISFIGGSLSNTGGHNPIEAIKLDSLVISGNQTHNFTDIYNELAQKKACQIVNNIHDVESILNKYFKSPDSFKPQQQNAKKFLKEKDGILEKTKKELL